MQSSAACHNGRAPALAPTPTPTPAPIVNPLPTLAEIPTADDFATAISSLHIDPQLQTLLSLIVTDLAQNDVAQAEIKKAISEMTTKNEENIRRLTAALMVKNLAGLVPNILSLFTPLDQSRPPLKCISTISARKIYKRDVPSEKWSRFVQQNAKEVCS